jgi:hypothetical protein
MARPFVGIVATAAALLVAGCLNFQEQTMTYRYDSATDALRIFQDYHGIFGDSQPGRLSDDELEQLDSVLESERTFFFGNWIFELNRVEMVRELATLRKGRLAETSPSAARLEAFLALVLDNLHIRNGPVYFDCRGRLSGVQEVTVTHVTALIAAFNEFLVDRLREQAAAPHIPERQRALFLAAAAEHREFASRSGNAFVFRWPETAESYQEKFDSPEGREHLKLLRANGIDVSFANDEMQWRFGSSGAAVTAITLRVSEREYWPNAVDSVRERVTILDAFDASAAAQKFLWAGDSFESDLYRRKRFD